MQLASKFANPDYLVFFLIEPPLLKTQNMMIPTNEPLNSLHLSIWKARARYGYDLVYGQSTKVIIDVLQL